MIRRVRQFIEHDVWRVRLRKLTGARSFGMRTAQIIILTFRGFDEDKCHLRASALTFFSLLAVVPVAAMAFAVAKGFGFENNLETLLLERFHGQEEVIKRIMDFARKYLEEVKGGVVGGIGVAILFYSVLKVLSNIEHSFNDIWGIKKMRSFPRMFSDYMSFILVCPLLFIVTSSLTVFLYTKLHQQMDMPGWLTFAADQALRLAPYLGIWLMFMYMYMFMPNTKVRFKSAVLSAFIAGTLFQLLQTGYIYFQIGVSRYNAIYGSFAALPLFLIWLQISWLIVLFGAELCFAHQNVETYEYEPDCLSASHAFKRLLSLRVAQHVVRKFCAGESPPTAMQIFQDLEIPSRLGRQILFDLVNAGVLTEMHNNGLDDPAYHPAVDVNKVTVNFVVQRLEHRGSRDVPVANDPQLMRLEQSLAGFSNAFDRSDANILLKDL